jgi:translation initiation factor 5
MASLNIGGGDDEFNRYKMPSVIGKVEGKGNGIKTRIANCEHVAKALHRPPGYLCKFFGCELGALTKIDEEDGVYIVNGAFEDRVLQETVKKFIEMFVLCAKCQLPETDMRVKKNGDIRQLCNACGNDSVCDMTHKLCTYIYNNPPDGKKKKDAAGGKVKKAERRAKKQAAVEAAQSGGAVKDEDEERRARKAAKKAAKKAAADAEATEAATPATSTVGVNGNGAASGGSPLAAEPGGGEDDDGDDVEWSVDMSKEAQEARARDMGGTAAALLERTSIVDDHALATKLRAYMDDGKKPRKVVDKAAKIFDGEEHAVRGVIAAALVDETAATAEESIGDRAAPVLAHYGTPMSAEAQSQALAYFDFVAAKDPESPKLFPFVLKALYDADLLEEDVIVAWFNAAAGRKDVREAVREVVQWLENASEEGSDDDGDDDDDDDDNNDDNDDNE